MTDSQFERVRIMALTYDKPPDDWREILGALVEMVVELRDFRQRNAGLMGKIGDLGREIDTIDSDLRDAKRRLSKLEGSIKP